MAILQGVLSGFDKLFGLVDDLTLSKEEKSRLNLELQALHNTVTMKELEIAQTEASHPSIFVAGARPAMKWVVNIALLTNFVLQPILNWLGPLVAPESFTMMPRLDTDELMLLVSGGFGLYTARAWEGINGTKRDNLVK